MTVLFILILAVLQGILEFLPVSSFGHMAFLQQMFGMEHGPGVLLETMLHVGTLGAVVLTFYKDIRHIAAETGEIAMDIVGNASLYIKNRRSRTEQYPYTKIFSSTYRKFTVMLWISMIPTFFIGFSARRLAQLAAVSPLIPGAGILVTGIVLLVTDFSGAGGTKAAKDITYSNAMWIGICQGLSVFPGLSRTGLTMSAGFMSGFSRAFAVKYSYILSIPAIVGALFAQIGQFGSSDMTVGLGFAYILGMIVSAVVGYFTIHYLLKLLFRCRFRYFAIYCFIAGIFSLVFNYM